MKYSVIMPSFIRESSHIPVVEATIASVREKSKDYEFIIVDDGSLIGSSVLRSSADTYIRHTPPNRGIAPSWNDGLRVARGDFKAVINDDILVPREWLEKLSQGLTVGVSAPKNGYREGEHTYKWYPGYCFMVTQQTLDQVGYFDEQFVPFNFEDLDYWTRVLKEGLPMIRADFEIWHKEGDVLHKLDYDGVSKKNHELFIKKHNFDPQPVFFGDAPFPKDR